MRKRDRYLKIVEWSEEDRCYVGTSPGLMLGGVHGDDEVRVYEELGQVIDEWIEILEEGGKPLPPATVGRKYSGKFLLRVGKDLHKEMAIRASRAGKSLNAYCVDVLSSGRSAPPSHRDGRNHGHGDGVGWHRHGSRTSASDRGSPDSDL